MAKQLPFRPGRQQKFGGHFIQVSLITTMTTTVSFHFQYGYHWHNRQDIHTPIPQPYAVSMALWTEQIARHGAGKTSPGWSVHQIPIWSKFSLVFVAVAGQARGTATNTRRPISARLNLHRYRDSWKGSQLWCRRWRFRGQFSDLPSPGRHLRGGCGALKARTCRPTLSIYL